MNAIAREPIVLGSVLYHADAQVARWVGERVPQLMGRTPHNAVSALGVFRRGEFVAGVVFHNYRPDAGDVEITVAAEKPTWCMPAVLKQLFDYPFGQMGVQRITMMTAKSNKRCRRLVSGLGWKLEGVIRKAFDGREDLCVYGLMADECKFWSAR